MDTLTLPVPPKALRTTEDKLLYIYFLILENPQHWNQAFWHCGTTHCFAGLCHLVAKNLPIDTDVLIDGDNGLLCYKVKSKEVSISIFQLQEIAIQWAGISEPESFYLFKSSNSLEDLKLVIDLIIYCRENYKDFTTEYLTYRETLESQRK